MSELAPVALLRKAKQRGYVRPYPHAFLRKQEWGWPHLFNYSHIIHIYRACIRRPVIRIYTNVHLSYIRAKSFIYLYSAPINTSGFKIRDKSNPFPRFKRKGSRHLYPFPAISHSKYYLCRKAKRSTFRKIKITG